MYFQNKIMEQMQGKYEHSAALWMQLIVPGIGSVLRVGLKFNQKVVD